MFDIFCVVHICSLATPMNTERTSVTLKLQFSLCDLGLVETGLETENCGIGLDFGLEELGLGLGLKSTVLVLYLVSHSWSWSVSPSLGSF